MKYKIVVFMRIDAEDEDDPLTFDSLNEAVEEKKHLQFLQPENKYEIEPVDEDDTMDEVIALNGG